MKRLLPYLFPLFTVISISTILLLNPKIIGYTVFDDGLTEGVEIRILRGEIIPEESFVMISLNDEVREVNIGEFIEIAGGEYELGDGGYTGDYVYRVDIRKFNFTDFRNKNELIVKVVYNNETISENDVTF